LLLVHGVYAGASSLEFRANFEELSGSFRVYALDLLGCGFSQKPRRRYGPEDVASQIEAFVREEIGAGAHLVASSLSAALVVPAAVRSPKVFKKLVLVCPTGYGTLDRPSGLLGDAILGLFRTPILGESLYHALVSRAGTRYYLEKMAYHDPRLVTEDVVEDYYRAGHGPGAKHFPAAFVAGKLNLGIPDLWPRVPHKSLVCWGREARTVPVSDQPPGRTPRLQGRRPAPPRRAGRDLQRGSAEVFVGLKILQTGAGPGFAPGSPERPPGWSRGSGRAFASRSPYCLLGCDLGDCQRASSG
jgi:pimeloyl-ACP methyl ester carboxylesterase